jgi:hypothetical protein
MMDGMDASLGVLQRVESLLNLPGVRAVETEISALPGSNGRAPVEMRAVQLPRP